MDTRHLEAFRAVVESGSMTGAAKILGKSQPAVSNLITRLEDEIDLRLFNRQRGKLEATPEAALFYEEVCRALASVDRAALAAREIRRTRTGPLLIASPPGLATYTLPQLIAPFLRERQGVTLRFITRSSQSVRDLIAVRGFDVGFAELPVEPSAINVERFEIECVCVLRADDPLAQRTVITPRLLNGRPFVSLFREHITYEGAARAFAGTTAKWNVVAEAEFFGTACALVQNGLGVTIVDPPTAAHFRKHGLVARRFRPAVKYAFALFQPAHKPPSRVALEFIAAFRSTFRQYQARPLPDAD
jgi:DNA-binding transcriptional LysR family regulator